MTLNNWVIGTDGWKGYSKSALANDLHQNAFSGQIIRLNFIEGYASVVDEDGEIFDVDFDNIEVC